MSKEVIFVPDDFGLNPEINDAIIHAYRSGHLTAAALIMAQPASPAAVVLAREKTTLPRGTCL